VAGSTDAATLVRREDVLTERVHEETLILDLAGDRCTRLNRSGSLLWEALVEPCSLAELAGRLERVFSLEGESALRDAEAFVRELSSRGLVGPAPG
jgi:Coenzyme PQQ synthesis protein D (PqqD)